MSIINVAFFGTPEFSAPSLKALINNPAYNVLLIVTQPDKPVGRGKKVKFSIIKEIAFKNNIPCLQPNNIKKEMTSFNDEFKKHNIDVAVVLAFGQILPKKLLEIPKYGFINIHASLLPRWRGAAPIQHCILAGDKETGTCLMQMEEGLDTGPYYSSSKIPINQEDDAGIIHDSLSELSAKLIDSDLIKIINKEIAPTIQDDSLSTYASKILKEDEKISWNDSGKKIVNQIRAMSPYPGAYSLLNNKRLKIFKAKFMAEEQSEATGKILNLHKNRLEIACKDGVIFAYSVQLEGKRKMSIAEFANGSKIELGEILN